jgi:ABC-2 type transport system permease protein
MKGLIAVYRREMGSYFVSPIAYIVVGLFLLVCGWFFYRILTFFIEQSVTAQMRGMQMGAPPAMDVPGLVIQSFFGIVSTIILFLLPMLTMGIYAEERKRGTMELLMTSPLTEFQIVFGKFLAALSLFLVMLAPTLIYQVIMASYAEPSIPWAVLWSGYLGLVLLGAVLVALGAFISSLTEPDHRRGRDVCCVPLAVGARFRRAIRVRPGATSFNTCRFFVTTMISRAG